MKLSILAVQTLAVLVLGQPAQDRGLDVKPTRLEEPAPRRSCLQTLAAPSLFEPNLGQSAREASFVGRAGGRVLLVRDDGAEIRVPQRQLSLGESSVGPAVPHPPRTSASFRFEGARPGGTAAHRLLSSRSHHFIGNDPALWRTDIPNFELLRRPGLYPGVDLEWLASEGSFEYRFTVAPAADPCAIRIAFPGCGQPRVARDGSLVVEVGGGRMIHSRPVAFQGESSDPRVVESSFRVHPDGTAGFRVGAYDRSRPLVIDPRVDFSTYFGSTSKDEDSRYLALDPDGNPCLAGRVSFSGSVTTTAGAFQNTHGGQDEVFVCKFDGVTRVPIFTTYFGGSDQEILTDLAVDSAGNPVIVGSTNSFNLPTKSALQSSKLAPTSNYDMFISKFAPDGASLVFSTYFGVAGSSAFARGVALDSSEDILVCGSTQSSSFPTSNAFLPSKPGGGSSDSVLVKIKGDGTQLLVSTYLPSGGATEIPSAIAIDDDGGVYVVGHTESSDLPTRSAAQSSRPGLEDGFVLKVNSDLDDYDYLTYIGGSARDDARELSVDSSGRAHIYGDTRSSNFPTVGAYDSSLAGTSDAFYTVLSDTGASIVYSTLLGGSGLETGGDFLLMPDGSRILVGRTSSTDFPTVAALQASYGGGAEDVFVSRLSADGTSLLSSTYIGGSGGETAIGAELAGSKLYVSGYTDSSNFPTVSPYSGTNTAGTVSPFLFRIELAPLAPTNLEAMLTDLTIAQIEWVEIATDESAVQLERKTDTGAYEVLASLPPDAAAFEDSTLERGNSYTYRVAAVGADGISAYSNESAVFSPPVPVLPPSAPTGLSVQVNGVGQPVLSWQDNSIDEEEFQINRNVSGGTFAIRASVISGTTTFLDTAVLPDRTYSYGVRALNMIGVSSFTPAAGVTTPPSVDLTIEKGALTDSGKVSKDKIQLTALIAVNGLSPDGVFDPVADGLTLRLGAEGQGPLLAIGTADPGWVPKKQGKFRWKSPKGSITKIKVDYDPAAGALKLSLSKLNFAVPPANPIIVWLGGANDAGHFEADWHVRKPGVLKYPVPVPK